jgi:hypothetical protein
MRDWGNKFQYPIPNDQIEFVWNLLLGTLDGLECERHVIASEAKQSPEIATPACRNFILLGTPVFKHSGVQARRPAKAGLLAMTSFGFSKQITSFPP